MACPKLCELQKLAPFLFAPIIDAAMACPVCQICTLGLPASRLGAVHNHCKQCPGYRSSAHCSVPCCDIAAALQGSSNKRQHVGRPACFCCQGRATPHRVAKWEIPMHKQQNSSLGRPLFLPFTSLFRIREIAGTEPSGTPADTCAHACSLMALMLLPRITRPLSADLQSRAACLSSRCARSCKWTLEMPT